MTSFLHSNRGRLALFVAAAAVAIVGWRLVPSQASDHADTAENANRPGADLADLYIFPSATDPTHVVLAMNLHPLIPLGQGTSVSFDPRVLYQFKIDVTGDAVEDYVIQAKFEGLGPNQQVLIAGPMKPQSIGTVSTFARRLPGVGTINTSFSPTAGMTVFAGGREDPFFFDLERFFQILPDRATPLQGVQVDQANPNAPQLTTFRGFNPANHPPGADTSPAMDLLDNFNVLSIVIDLPRSKLSNNGTLGKIGVWMTTSVFTGSPNFNYIQQDRLARPAVNEVLATVTNRRHEFNNKHVPTDDPSPAALKGDIESFLVFPAGRSLAIRTVIESILTPDVMIADLSKSGDAAYLGVETAGAFGGRKLSDDIVDTSLGPSGGWRRI